jgi:hypothetical protein
MSFAFRVFDQQHAQFAEVGGRQLPACENAAEFAIRQIENCVAFFWATRRLPGGGQLVPRRRLVQSQRPHGSIEVDVFRPIPKTPKTETVELPFEVKAK